MKIEFRFGCFSFAKLDEAMKCISNYISTNPNTLSRCLPYDESTLVKKISSQLSVSKSTNDVELFRNCYEQLSSVVSFVYVLVASDVVVVVIVE